MDLYWAATGATALLVSVAMQRAYALRAALNVMPIADPFLAKPFTIESLTIALQHALAGAA